MGKAKGPRYRKIDPRIWNDEKFRQFSDRAKLAFLFVLTQGIAPSGDINRGRMVSLKTIYIVFFVFNIIEPWNGPGP